MLLNMLGKLWAPAQRPAEALTVAPAKPYVPPIPSASSPEGDVPQRFVWQRLSRPSEVDYGLPQRNEAISLLAFEPRFVLDVGCASGGVATAIKETCPQCKVWGIEPDAKAAEIARTRMDKVISTPLDQIDWAAHAVGVGEIDTVFLLDVLEHMYDPWHTLALLRGMVHPDAQVVISLPNVRNVMLIRDLLNGYWRYRDTGLLDATHIRFFTEYEAKRLIYQTGFRIERQIFTLCPGFAPVYEEIKNHPFPQTLTFEKASLRIDSEAELKSFAAMQHLFLVRPALRHMLSADEQGLADDPHPQTYAGGIDAPGVI